MRKITSKKIEEKKRKKNQIIIGGALILILALGTIGYSMRGSNNETTESILFNGLEFTKENNLWYTNIGEFIFSFYYNPLETEEISTDLRYLNEYANQPLYIYYENNDAMIEIYRNLFYNNLIVERVQEACPEGYTCNEDFPIKNCTNNFIIIENSEDKKIRQEQNCVFISGKNEELVKIVDEFLFNIMGIQ
jgi:hypothetical protein